MLIYLFGHVFGLYQQGHRSRRASRSPSSTSAPSPPPQKLIDALKAEKAFRVITTHDLGEGRHPAADRGRRARRSATTTGTAIALILPADLLPDDGFGVHMKFLFNPRNEIEAQMVNGLLQKTVFSNVPQLLGQSLQKNARRFLGGERFERFNRTIANTVADNFGGDREEIYQRNIAGDFGFSDLGRTGAKTEPAHRLVRQGSAAWISRATPQAPRLKTGNPEPGTKNRRAQRTSSPRS